jgi:decaprenylphospho-beta-D-ribofuranose 2-oxidase
MGLTGILREATVRLARVKSGWFSVRYEAFGDLKELLVRMREGALRDPYLVAWLDLLASSPRAVLAIGQHTEGEASERRQASRRLPIGAPNFLLNRPLMRLYNSMRFRRLSALREGQREWFTDFLYPLDAIENWNVLYGPRGFVQYQFAVPYETAHTAIPEVLALLAARGQSIVLAVLKSLGDEAGPLSFPRRGVTLALDLPMTGASLLNALDELDERVVAHLGRVYLAKDSRMKGRWLPTMYPRLEEWRETKRNIDPRNVFQSDLSRRLNLT